MILRLLLILLSASTLHAQATRPAEFTPRSNSILKRLWHAATFSTPWTLEATITPSYRRSLDFDRDDPILIQFTAEQSTLIGREKVTDHRWKPRIISGPTLYISNVDRPWIHTTVQCDKSTGLDFPKFQFETGLFHWSYSLEFDAMPACRNLPDGRYELCVRWPGEYERPTLVAKPVQFRLGETTYKDARLALTRVFTPSVRVLLSIDQLQDHSSAVRATLINLTHVPIEFSAERPQGEEFVVYDAGDREWFVFGGIVDVFKSNGWIDSPVQWCDTGEASVRLQPFGCARLLLKPPGERREIWRACVNYLISKQTACAVSEVIEFIPSTPPKN